MQKKSGKYLADWRDRDGARHRKAFSTAKEARDFSRKMREAAHQSKNR